MLYLSCQRYKSKAIHNFPALIKNKIMAVFIMSKIQIESNSQPQRMNEAGQRGCIYHVKDTNRKQFTTCLSLRWLFIRLYLSCQRYKSKAIHNLILSHLAYNQAVFIMSKIQIESNSQLLHLIIDFLFGCIYHVKDTNRKQFTTQEMIGL